MLISSVSIQYQDRIAPRLQRHNKTQRAKLTLISAIEKHWSISLSTAILFAIRPPLPFSRQFLTLFHQLLSFDQLSFTDAIQHLTEAVQSCQSNDLLPRYKYITYILPQDLDTVLAQLLDGSFYSFISY